MTDLEKDARRWSYVRKYLAHVYGLNMNGDHRWAWNEYR